MRTRNIYITAIIIIIAAYFVGLTMSEQCISIADNKACWKLYPISVSSEFCPNASECVATPELQQHNAIVSLLLDACETAKAFDYSNTEINSGITGIVKNFFDYDLSAQQVCEQPAMIFTYREYG